MQFGFPKKRQLRYQDFQRLRPAQKLGRAASFMKLAVKYAEACNAYQANFRYAAIVIGVMLGAIAALQAFEFIPGWLPGWLLGIMFWNGLVRRIPELKQDLIDFLTAAGASTASRLPDNLKKDYGSLYLLIWTVTGYMSGDWLTLNAGMTGFVLATFFFAIFRVERMIAGNLEAMETAGRSVMRIAEEAKAELESQDDETDDGEED